MDRTDTTNRVGIETIKRPISALQNEAQRAAISTLQDALENKEGCWTPQEQLQAAKIILDHLKD